MDKIMIFIDGSNLYHGLKGNNCSTRVDFLKLSEFLTGPRRKFIRTYYYNAVCKQKDDPQKYAEQSRFFAALRKTPYLTLKLGRLVKHIIKFDQDFLTQELGSTVADKVIETFGEEVPIFSEDLLYRQAVRPRRSIGSPDRYR